MKQDLTDYFPKEELYINTEPIIGFAEAGDTSCVSGYGVRCYSSDTSDKLTVRLAAQNAGWGVALKTVGTANDPVPVLLRGIIKMVVGAGGSTRDFAQSFGAAGLLADMTAGYTTGPTAQKVAWALQSSAAAGEVLYLFTG